MNPRYSNLKPEYPLGICFPISAICITETSPQWSEKRQRNITCLIIYSLLFLLSLFGLRSNPLIIKLNNRIVVESVSRISLNVNPKVRLSNKINFFIFIHVVRFCFGKYKLITLGCNFLGIVPLFFNFVGL